MAEHWKICDQGREESYEKTVIIILCFKLLVIVLEPYLIAPYIQLQNSIGYCSYQQDQEQEEPFPIGRAAEKGKRGTNCTRTSRHKGHYKPLGLKV